MAPDALTPLTGELLARVIVPAMAESLACHGLLPRALGGKLECRVLAGRLYLDAEALRDPLLRLLDEASAPRAGLVARAEVALRLPRLLGSLLRLEGLERECCAALRRLSQDLERQPMTSRDDGALLGLLRLDGIRDEIVAMPPAGALAQLCAPAAYAALAYMVRHWTDEPPESAGLLVSGLHGMVDVECASALWDLAEEARRIPELMHVLAEPAPRMARLNRLAKASAFCAGLHAFLNRFGHRGPAEVELARPRWREDAEPLLAVIASYLPLGADASPRVAEWRQHWQREAALARVRRALRLRPLRRVAFERALGVAQRASVAAANVRFETCRLYAALRGAALELGARLARAARVERSDDVFFLSLDELERAEPADLRERVAARRAQHARDADLQPPPAVDADGLALELPVLPARSPGALRGIAASAGRARGRVWILGDSAPPPGPPPGNVLVAAHADPAWAPLFAVAAAVVVETGGLLSPASIIARELGIPSVVAVAGATTHLSDGEEVEVDGTNGTVARVGSAKAASGAAA